MYKSTIFLLFACNLLSAASTERGPFKPWVRDTSTVQVKSLTKMTTDVPVTDTTTVENMKASIETTEGVPSNWQEIYISKRRWLFCSEHIKLANDASVKFAMDVYNSKDFLLRIKLPS